MLSLSVIIPALNEEGEIGDLLDRLGRQDHTGPIEVIVVDGGSTDTTRDIVREHEGVRLLQTAPGVSRQRNAGASVATGDLIVFLDADNAPANGFLRRVVSQYQRQPFTVACPCFVPRTGRPDIHLFYAVMNGLFFLSQLRYHMGAGVCLITPRSVFARTGGFDETLHLGEDIDYMRRAAALGRHRHLPMALSTSTPRIESLGMIRMALFYARISPALLSGDRETLRSFSYPPIRNKPRR